MEKVMYSLVLTCLFSSFVYSTSDKLRSNYHITDLKYEKCDNNNYPITIENITILLNDRPKYGITGRINVEEQLIAPIKAAVAMERKFLGIWVPVPCVDNVGTCKYDDLCELALPKPDCPEKFTGWNLPCKCPIPMGNYTFDAVDSISEEGFKSFLSGSYKGIISISHQKELLSCYHISFNLKVSERNEIPEVILV